MSDEDTRAARELLYRVNRAVYVHEQVVMLHAALRDAAAEALADLKRWESEGMCRHCGKDELCWCGLCLACSLAHAGRTWRDVEFDRVSSRILELSRALATQQPPPSPRADVGAPEPPATNFDARAHWLATTWLGIPCVLDGHGRHAFKCAFIASELATAAAGADVSSPPVQSDEPPVYSAEEDARLDDLEAAQPDVAVGEALPNEPAPGERVEIMGPFGAFRPGERSYGAGEWAPATVRYVSTNTLDGIRYFGADVDGWGFTSQAVYLVEWWRRIAYAPPSPPGEPPGYAVVVATPGGKP